MVVEILAVEVKEMVVVVVVEILAVEVKEMVVVVENLAVEVMF